MEKVLITGANGFTGGFLSRLMTDSGYEVIGTCYNNISNGFIQLDLSDKEAVDSTISTVKPDYIIHLAGLSYVAHSDNKSFYDINLFGTMNLLQSISSSSVSVKKIIIASSANVYGDVSDGHILDESFPPEPVNHYGMSKLAMEYMSKQYDSVPIIFTRPMNYTGPGQEDRFLIPKIISHFANDCTEIELGNIDVYRDFSDVRDVARYYLGLIESDFKKGVVNICSGQLYSIKDIINLVEDITGKTIEVKVNQDFIRDNEIKVLAGNPKMIRCITGMSPSYTLKDTLEYMYSSFNV
ncbi:GDP-mannose 4,6-dehydratase [Vibrio cyclitrophicus]